MFHELTAANAYRDRPSDLSYWRLASGIEVDFVIGDLRVGLEAKATRRITDDHLRGLRHLRQDHPRVKLAIVCLEPKRRRTTDGIDIMPVADFVDSQDELLSA